jgi:hypothetical protein
MTGGAGAPGDWLERVNELTQEAPLAHRTMGIATRSFMQGRISFGASKLHLMQIAERADRVGSRFERPSADGPWSSAARQVAVLVVVGIVGRLVLAFLIGLGVDESYEVVLSRRPSLGYFDHPPLSFWIPGLVARLAGTEHRVPLRLPFILLFAGTTILLYRLTARLYGERAGLLAAVLLNVSLVFSVSTGSWILPDGPLDFAMVAAVLCLTHVVLGERPARSWQWWIAAGVATGVALLSKYHGAFLLAGTFLFLVSRRASRRWLTRPEPYVAVAVALAIATPMLLWNAQHDFASIRFQAARATTHGIHLGALAKNVAGQLGVVLPWIGVPLVWQLLRGLWTGPRDAPRWLLTCLAVGPIAFFTLVSLGGNPGLPHWPTPGYLFLFPLLGDALAQYESRGPRERTRSVLALGTAAIGLLILLGVAVSQIETGWMTRVAPTLFRRGDPSLEAMDWSDLRPELARRGLLNAANQFVVATHWIDAAKIGYALGPSIPVICLSDDPRGFQYAYPPAEFLGRDAIILLRTGRGTRHMDVQSHYAPYFRSIQPADTLAITRSGRAEIELGVFRARQLITDRDQ